MELFLSFLLGLLLGGAVGWVLGRRARPNFQGAGSDYENGSTHVVERAALLFSSDEPEELNEALRAAQGAITERTEKRLARILEQAQTDGRITNDGVEELFCISDRTASNYLKTLVERGELVREGVGRGTFYTPK